MNYLINSHIAQYNYYIIILYVRLRSITLIVRILENKRLYGMTIIIWYSNIPSSDSYAVSNNKHNQLSGRMMTWLEIRTRISHITIVVSINDNYTYRIIYI